MSMYRKVRAVERVFQKLEKEVATFQKATKLHCAPNCGLCCRKADISATALEFLPLAYALYKNGQLEAFYEAARSKREDTYCMNLSPFLNANGGFCTKYNYRGLICRLFGFTAMLDKNGQPKLVTCSTIKTNYSEAFRNAEDHIASGKEVPVMRNYYFQLKAIDPSLGVKQLPINQAILEAATTVMAYYAYRPRRTA